MRQQLEQRYELKDTGRLGPGVSDGKEMKVLNRVIRWTEGGVEYEGDPRQVERLIFDLGLENSKKTGSPGVKRTFEQITADSDLPQEKHTAFRGVAARCIYLSSDHPAVHFASKEICRWMSAPTEGGVSAVRRLGRYLGGHHRVVYDYPWQEAESVEVYSDTEWAGCVKTRKSTSGGGPALRQTLDQVMVEYPSRLIRHTWSRPELGRG